MRASRTLYDCLEQFAAWWRIGLLVAGYGACLSMLALRESVLAKTAKGPYDRVLDTRLWYTPADAQTYFANISEGGRKLYAVSEITLDMLVPLCYGCALACLIARLAPPNIARLWVWAPVSAIVLDIGENLILAYLAFSFDGEMSSVSYLASLLTSGKWISVIASVVAALVGALSRGRALASPI